MTTKFDQNSPEYKKAAKRVKQLKEFYSHVQSYIWVNALLFLINFVTSRGTWWAYYTLVFWGIGLLFHAASVYVFDRDTFDQDWEDKKIQELMNKNKSK